MAISPRKILEELKRFALLVFCVCFFRFKWLQNLGFVIKFKLEPRLGLVYLLLFLSSPLLIPMLNLKNFLALVNDVKPKFSDRFFIILTDKNFSHNSFPEKWQAYKIALYKFL